MLGKKPKIGYSKKNKIKKKNKSYISSLFIKPKKHISLNEKIIKFLIYIALRLVIKPSKWRHPEKNYEIIDRTYKRIISADFIYIPSSIALYLIMAFMPILSLISFLYMIPGFQEWLSNLAPGGGSARDALAEILGKFIPGAKSLINQINYFSSNTISAKIIAGYLTITLSLIITTWIASGGFAKLVFTQSYIYEHKFVGGYWMNKIKGMMMVLSFTLCLSIGFMINIIITTWINESIKNDFLRDALVHIWLIISLGLGIFLLMILLFRFSPRYKIKIKDVIPGAMVTTVPTLLFLSLFSFISRLWSYGSYGSLGTIMYVGMASLIISYFIFVGLIANAAYFKTFVASRVRTKWTLSKK